MPENTERLPKKCPNPKCGGSMIVERDWHGTWGSCIMCGYLVEVPTKPPKDIIEKEDRPEPGLSRTFSGTTAKEKSMNELSLFTRILLPPECQSIIENMLSQKSGRISELQVNSQQIVLMKLTGKYGDQKQYLFLPETVDDLVGIERLAGLHSVTYRPNANFRLSYLAINRQALEAILKMYRLAQVSKDKNMPEE